MLYYVPDIKVYPALAFSSVYFQKRLFRVRDEEFYYSGKICINF